MTASNFELNQDADFSGALTATDPENDTVTFAKTSEPASGQVVTFAASGAFIYRPNAGFTGVDSFRVTASDGANQVVGTITLTVHAADPGAGPDPGPVPDPDPGSQVLTFAQAGPLAVFVGDTLSNAASAPGSGVVTYRSSGTMVATVDGNGVATFVGVGAAEIRADKAGDAQFLAAHASYTVESAERSVQFSSWVGAENTLVTFPATASGLAFYRSSAADCDLANYASCADGQLDFLTSSVVTDIAATTTRAGYYVLEHGASLKVNTGLPSNRSDHPVVSFDGQLWLIGGYDGDRKNDVWSSSDGVTWAQQTVGAAFSPRDAHQVVIHDHQLWLIGGYDGGYLNDVWRSMDGIQWRLGQHHTFNFR